MNANSSQSEHLTSEQLNRLSGYGQKWLRFAQSTELIDQATAIEAIQAMYRRAKLEPPQIEFCANPLELRERVEAYLEGDAERWHHSGYYSRGSGWAKICRLDEPLWMSLQGQMGYDLFHDL